MNLNVRFVFHTFGIASGNVIWPITTPRSRMPSQSHGAFEWEFLSSDTVNISPAITSITTNTEHTPTTYTVSRFSRLCESFLFKKKKKDKDWNDIEFKKLPYISYEVELCLNTQLQQDSRMGTGKVRPRR